MGHHTCPLEAAGSDARRMTQWVHCVEGCRCVEDHPVPPVQQQCRGGDDLLLLIVRGFAIEDVTRHGESGPGDIGTAMIVTARIAGQPGPYGWHMNRFSLSWQEIPKVLGELMSDPDPGRAGRVMQAMLWMGKIDVAALHHAHAGA